MIAKTIQKLNVNILKEKAWIFLFSFCFIYWAYLITHTAMPIVFDSVDYENTGKIIYKNGWLEFFRTGPHREPLYPALIAAAMAVGDLFSVSYQPILKIFQVALLFLTQILLIVLLRQLDVRKGIIMAAVLYAGISPAMINGAYSVYYEIVSFPFVLAAVLLTASLWFDIHQKKDYGPVLWKSLFLGISFALLALGRGVFEYVSYFFVGSFCIAAIIAFFSKRPAILRRALVVVVIAFSIVIPVTTGMKVMSFRYNGQYVLCRSHLSILLASAYKRAEPITPAIVGAHLAVIPGTGVCPRFFSKEECDYADWYGTDKFRVTVVEQRMATIPQDQQSREVFRMTFEKIVGHPLQYAFFSGVEALKMPFWESTKIGFVGYPTFLAKAYDSPVLRFGLRLLLALMTIAGFVFVSWHLWRSRRQWRQGTSPQQSTAVLFFTWFMIAAYTSIYSLCYVITRYSLPIAATYIACIAFMVNACIAPKITKEEK